MNNKLTFIYWIIGVIILSVPAMVLGPILWPPAIGAPAPTPAQLGFFLAISLIESLLFSAGLIFLLFGFNVVRRAPAVLSRVAWSFYISTAWMLLSWWPHDNFHRSISESDLQKLLYIEYGFHFTLIVAGLAIAYTFFQIFKYIEEVRPNQN